MPTLKTAPLNDAQLWTCDTGNAQPAHVPHSTDPRNFEVALATERARDPTFCILWQALVADSDSPQKIYQTPAFFKFAQQACHAGERLELLSVTRISDGALVGVVPLRISGQDLQFKFGPFLLHNARLEMINLLGSIPAAPSGTALADKLLTTMLTLFPDAKAVMMPSLPQHSAHWHDVAAIRAEGGVLSTTLMGPWRECHKLPLTATFEQYLEKFSAKKRYNLNRQIRQLSEQVGTLELERVERPEQVASMMRALETLVPPARLSLLSREETFGALAAHDMLLCHVLRAGEQVLAAIVGTRSPDTLHVHNIFVDEKYLPLSIGTSAMHLVIKDLTEMGGLAALDFGFGTPNHDFRSSHVRETRAQVLVFDDTRSVSLLFFLHRHFLSISEGLIGVAKSLNKRLQSLRKAKHA